MDQETRAARAAFREELEDRVEAIRRVVARLDAEPEVCDPAAIHDLFRQLHSLKGAANLLGLRPIEQLAHRAEDVLALARERGVPRDAPLTAFVRSVCTRLEQLGDHLDRLRAIDLTAELARIDGFVRRFWSPAA